MESLALRNQGLKRLDLSVIQALGNEICLSDNSKKAYIQAGKDFNNFLESQALELTPESITKFFAEKGYKGATANLKRQALMTLVSNQAGIESNYLAMAAIKQAFKKEVKRVKIDAAILQDEYLKRYQIDEIKSKTSKRLSLIIEFSFVTGCRISELINIKLSDLKVNGVVKIEITGKGNKQRFVFCKVSLLNEINQVFQGVKYLFETRNHSQYNRINLFRDIKNAGKKANYTIHPHTFRHSCAMHLKGAGKDVQYIQKYLGHSTPDITIKFYFHEKPDLEIIDLF